MLLASSDGKEGVCVKSQRLFVAVGYCTADGVLYTGSRTAEMIVLGTRVVFCLTNDRCQRGCTREQVLLTARASRSLLNKLPTSHMVTVEEKAPCGTLITVLFGFGQCLV